MVARYKPWELLIILLSVKLRCLVFQIIVFKNPNKSPVPINIYISMSYVLDSISCSGLVRVTRYKSFFLADHDVTALLFRRRGGGGGTTIVSIMGQIPTIGGRGI